MGGVDASAGFAYQHAQAVHRVLDLADLDDAGYVRVEATNDVVDVEIYTGDDTLVRAAQFKIRGQQYTWGEAALVDELVRWSALAAKYPDARYEFVTDGRLGPTGREVQAALEMARNGDGADLGAIARHRNVTLDAAVCGRASIVADTPGFDQLLVAAVDRVAGLLPHVTGELEAEERGTQLVLELLRQVVGRSGAADPDVRVITRTELDALLSDSREYVGTESWSPDLRNEFVEVVRRNAPRGVALRCEVAGAGAQVGTSAEEESRPLDELIGATQILLLSGPTGTGKSTVIKQAQAAAAERGEIVIVVDAEAYVPKRLGSLIARGINTPGFVGAYSATGLKALSDSAVTVIIDGVSEIPSEERAALKAELKQFIASDVRAKLVLAGRDSTILQGMLPRHTPVYPVGVEQLNRERRLEILADLSQGELDDRYARELAAQAEHALQGAADNPQLFVVGIWLIAKGWEFTDPASMYRQYIHARAQEGGYTNPTVLEVGLGIAFAALADTGRRYCDSFAWTTQLNEAASALQASGHDVTTTDLREFGFETGLIIRSSGDVVRAVHDSFADYFAAAAHARAVSPLPEQLHPTDTARIRFLVELAGVTDRLSAQIASDLPFLVPAAAEREDLRPDESWCATTEVLVASLWPTAVEPPRIAFWQASDRHMVTVDGDVAGWLGERTLTEVGAGALTFEATGGPLNVATKIWRNRLRAQLDYRRRVTAPAPSTHEQTVTMLVAFSDALSIATRELVQQITPPGQHDSVLGAVGPCRIQFALDPDNDVADQRERGVRYRYVDNLGPDEAAVLEMVAGSDESWTGWGRVDAFLSQEPSHAAARIVSQAVNELVDRQWL
ncbi:ATP-binding protein [Rhodococcus sp. WB9]|uniref:ATP-binding protein n=1 Tax=Rhodococcus sp. WB9 TaxID=2594007 RepID=UPI0011849E3E|nr:ATP-binding protein [Rhodococcus sp. WB9]QDQ93039.1 ATP-binding protein [Rhodococcus sp. WB9]